MLNKINSLPSILQNFFADPTAVCAYMYCAIPDGSGYCSTAVPWEGTSCGNQKVGLKKWTTQDLDVCKWPSFFFITTSFYIVVYRRSVRPRLPRSSGSGQLCIWRHPRNYCQWHGVCGAYIFLPTIVLSILLSWEVLWILCCCLHLVHSRWNEFAM